MEGDLMMGTMLPQIDMTLEEVEREYDVTLNDHEFSTGSLYDTLTYPTAGQAEFIFFAEGNTGTKGKDKTNLPAKAELSSNQYFLVRSVEFLFLARENVSVSEAAAAISRANDQQKVYQNGTIAFNILDKEYFREAPVGRWTAQKGDIGISSAIAGTTTLTSLSQVNPIGEPYQVYPTLIGPNTDFNVKVSYPTLQTIGTESEIQVHLNGLLFRPLQ